MSLTERLRDYVIAEGDAGYTIAYAAWELGISVSGASKANRELLKLGIVKQVCPRVEKEGAVYAYNPEIPAPRQNVRQLFPELDTSRRVRSDVVPLTGRADGPSGKPGRDRKKQERGRRVRRARQGT